MGTRTGFGARAGRVLLAMSASTFLTAVVALPMAYQAHAARDAQQPAPQTTEVPPSVLGTSTVPTTAGIDPVTTTETTETTVAAGAAGASTPATTAPRSPGTRSNTTTTVPWFVSPGPAAVPSTTVVGPPSTTAPPAPTTTTTTAPRPSPQGLFFSTSTQLQSAAALDGSQIRESVYVFLDLPEVAQVAFTLDGTAAATEYQVPWELFGGKALDPGDLGVGAHTVQADVTFLDGRTEVRAAVFTISSAR